MPIYDYDCAACGRRIEVVHGVHSPGPTHCPNCGAGPLRKAISAPAVHFKGSGWAKRDRRATVTPGVSRTSTDGTSASDGERAASDGERADRERKDRGGAPDESKPKAGGDVESAGRGKRAAASTPATGAGAASQAD